MSNPHSLRRYNQRLSCEERGWKRTPELLALKVALEVQMTDFKLIDVGERAGSGISTIFRVWREQGWITPIIEEGFELERTTLSLAIKKSDDKKATSDDRK